MLQDVRLRLEQVCLCGEKKGLPRGVVLRRRVTVSMLVVLAVASLAYLVFLNECAVENAHLAQPCSSLDAVRAFALHTIWARGTC